MLTWLNRERLNIAILAISAGLIFFAHKQFETRLVNLNDEKFILPPIPALKKFTFGYNDILADIYLLRLIQNIEHCGQPKHNNFLAPDGRRIGRNRTPECSKGWSYQMLDYITELAPKNKLPFSFGPMTLSVIVDDIDGATALFNKALVQFPNDWEIAFGAGYHYMLELEDIDTAAKLYQKSAELGAPEWVHILAARLNSKIGQNDLAKTILKNYLENFSSDEIVRKRAEAKLKDIELSDIKQSK